MHAPQRDKKHVIQRVVLGQSVIGNFFSRMKCELNISKRSKIQRFSAHEIEDMVLRYIHWYNNKRIQKKLEFGSSLQLNSGL